jgi:uncharacterized protein YndB with AHSA1/START domain
VLIKVTRHIQTTPDKVWSVLTDGWIYPGWVVGASRMRAVEDGWPEAGTQLHHSAGVWPLVLNDSTRSLEYEPGRRMKLQAKGWPAGEATIELLVEPDGTGTLVTMVEDVTRGPATALPESVRQFMIGTRNKESLRRLGYLAERRSQPEELTGPPAGSRESLEQSDMHVDPNVDAAAALRPEG